MSLLDLNDNSDIKVYPSIIKEYIRKHHAHIDLDKFDVMDGFYKLDERTILIPRTYNNNPLEWYIYYENDNMYYRKPMIFISKWIEEDILEFLDLKIIETDKMIITLYDIIKN